MPPLRKCRPLPNLNSEHECHDVLCSFGSANCSLPNDLFSFREENLCIKNLLKYRICFTAENPYKLNVRLYTVSNFRRDHLNQNIMSRSFKYRWERSNFQWNFQLSH